jgi:GTPase SAR1 family protein
MLRTLGKPVSIPKELSIKIVYKSSIMMVLIQKIQNKLGITLHEVGAWGRIPDIENAVRYDERHGYVQENGEIVALNLRDCQLDDKNVTWLMELADKLPQLQALNLSENTFTRLAFSSSFSRLRFLNLSRNEALQIVSWGGEWTLLEKCDLSHCALQSLAMPPNLKALRQLNVHHNPKLESLSFKDECPKLSFLDAKKTRLSDLDSFHFLTALKHLYIETQGDSEYLKYFLQSGVEGVRVYASSVYESIQKGEALVKLNECKMLLVGWGGMGKTSLMKALMGEPFNPNEKQSHDINKRVWNKDILNPEGNPYQINVWDFGGQPIKHHLHQYFFSDKSLYLLILNKKDEEERQRYSKEDPTYWTKLISELAEDVPVLVVFTKATYQDSDGEWRTQMYKELRKNSNILDGFFVTDAQTKKEIPELKQKIKNILDEKLPIVFEEYSPKWMEVKKWVEEQTQKGGRHFLDYSTFEDKCTKRGMSAKEAEVWINNLHCIGTITYLKGISSAQILNPDWLTQGAYYLMESSTAKRKEGILTDEDIKDILEEESEDKKYKYAGKSERDLLQQFMMTKDMLYKQALPRNEHQWILAAALPEFKPELPPDVWSPQSDVQKFHLQFADDVNESIMLRFITKTLGLAVKNGYWKGGIMLEFKDKVHAEIMLQKNARRIEIKMYGKNFRDHWVKIRVYLEDILEMYKGLKYDFEVLLPSKLSEFVPIPERDILSAYEDGRAIIEYDARLRTSIDVNKVLGLLASLDQNTKDVDRNFYINFGQAGAMGEGATAKENKFEQHK